ncbi:hypothetical protein MMC25_007665 [Agyrium rufum]|nr:hypothetical protein [Agyrium rufum]
MPYEEAQRRPQDPAEVGALVRNLENAAKGSKFTNRYKKGKGGFSCKSSTFPIAGSKGISVKSWRFMDWDYKRDDLPTYARGLFTYERQDKAQEIAIRGYDKFFNIDEVNDTQWRNIEMLTRGPYELSVKENGCIIFISGLEDNALLVCSKHSTGPRQDADLSHAVAGEKWVDKIVEAVGKSREDLARELRRFNLTAVAELCDDTFEEHVLGYDEKAAGLYLHGMNLNVPEFTTWPSALVHKFADTWGFKKAEFLLKDNVSEVESFLKECNETGSWNGRETEGFVIRCQKKDPAGRYIDWFFKYKFEEPYLMYRQWREATKAVIAGRTPNFKKHKKISEEYILFAKRQLAKDPKLGKAYQMNHGIIKMRDDFLKERGLKGSDIIRQSEAENEAPGNVAKNVILVPIASIGCGKTTVAVGLTELFGWGHVQNDNITGKGRPKIFATQVTHSLVEHPVVIADRNNHQKRERDQLYEDINRVLPEAKFVALHYVHDPKSERLPDIRRATQERVLTRGDNHQTIRAGSKSKDEIVGIMDGFLHRFEPLDTSQHPDDMFDTVIDLDPVDDSRQNLEIVINALHKSYPKLVPNIPSAQDLDEAINAALNDYAPDIKHDLEFRGDSNRGKDKGRRNNQNDLTRQPKVFEHGDLGLQPHVPPLDENDAPSQTRAVPLHNRMKPSKPTQVEYFGITVPSATILSILSQSFSNTQPGTVDFYNQLQRSNRVQPAFHVTLIHRALSKQKPDLWSHYTHLYESASTSENSTAPILGKVRIKLEQVVWDTRIMCIAVRILDQGWHTANEVPHITIGTRDPSVKPKESNDLLAKWLEVGPNEGLGIKEGAVVGGEGVWGQVVATMAR